MAEFEKFTCCLTTGDGVTEIGSGVIVQIDLEELLQQPSCLEKKVHGELFAHPSQPCYALITAHSNVYKADCKPEAPEPSAVECLRERRVVLVKSDDPVGKYETIDDSCVSCRAVSCCGIDSMLRMPQPSHDPTQRPRERHLHYTLKSHDPSKCNIGYDFVMVFLKTEVVRRWFPEESHRPPILTHCSQLPNILQDPFEVHMCWRSARGSVERKNVGIKIPTGHPESQPQMRGLGNEISYFEAYQSLQYIQQEGEGAPGIQSHFGAPIVLRNTRTGTSHLIGINTGEGVTTFYGIWKLLKGGVVPFFAAMRHPTANARSLKPSRWKDYVLPHVDPHMQSLDPTLRGQYVVDLLHFLLEKRDEDEVTIMKLPPVNNTDTVIAGLNILTEILNKLKNVQGVHQCCDEAKCFKEFCSTDLKKCLQRYAQHIDNPYHEGMVEATFECFEALLNYKAVAREVLEENLELLKKIATHEHYDSNSVVNRCCKNIFIKECEYLKAERYERHAHTDELQLKHHGRPGRHMSVQERSRDAMIHGRVGHMLSSRSASELVRAGDSSSLSLPDLYFHPQEEHGHN